MFLKLIVLSPNKTFSCLSWLYNQQKLKFHKCESVTQHFNTPCPFEILYTVIYLETSEVAFQNFIHRGYHGFHSKTIVLKTYIILK